jgi:hypothetical protein
MERYQESISSFTLPVCAYYLGSLVNMHTCLFGKYDQVNMKKVV